MDFEGLGLHSALLGALARLEHTNPTPVQAQAIPAAIAGEDLLVSSHTGSGKTAAFLLPALHRLAGEPADRRARIVILTPTRELALQIERAARDYMTELRNTGRRLRTACLIGGAPFGPQLHALSEGPEVLIATPGRLIDHLERGRLDMSGVRTLVLDEADRMLDMGFVEDIDAIAAQLPAERQTLLFSATLDGRVAPVAQRLTRSPRRIEIAHRIDTERLTEVVHHADDLDHKNKLLDAVLATDGLEQAIIFTSTKLSAEDLATRLRDGGHAVAALHGDLPQHARNRVVRWMHERRIQVVVATDVAARGIDVPTISHVINFDLPMKAEDYVHRIGRTARAGRAGTSVSFAGRADRGRLFGIERLLGRPLPVATLPGLEPRFANVRGERRGDGRRGGFGGGGYGRRDGGAPRFGRPEGFGDRGPRFGHGAGGPGRFERADRGGDRFPAGDDRGPARGVGGRGDDRWAPRGDGFPRGGDRFGPRPEGGDRFGPRPDGDVRFAPRPAGDRFGGRREGGDRPAPAGGRPWEARAPHGAPRFDGERRFHGADRDGAPRPEGGRRFDGESRPYAGRRVRAD